MFKYTGSGGGKKGWNAKIMAYVYSSINLELLGQFQPNSIDIWHKHKHYGGKTSLKALEVRVGRNKQKL